jgi:hypothetical protein
MFRAGIATASYICSTASLVSACVMWSVSSVATAVVADALGGRSDRQAPSRSPPRPRGAATRGHPPKSTSFVSTVPAVRRGAWWLLQYRFVCAMTASGGGAPQGVRSSVVCASLTSVAS